MQFGLQKQHLGGCQFHNEKEKMAVNASSQFLTQWKKLTTFNIVKTSHLICVTYGTWLTEHPPDPMNETS
jgi:hypothetical protein